MRQRTWKSAFDRGHVELNVIPLIDVVFFLLVFYVISTSFAPEASLAIERPASSQAQTIAGEFLTVAVTASGQIQVGPQSTDLAGLPADDIASAAEAAPACRCPISTKARATRRRW